VLSRVTRVPLFGAAIGTVVILAAGCAGGSSTGGHAGGSPAGTAASLSARQAIELAAKNTKTLTSIAATFSIQFSAAGGGAGISGTVTEQLHPSLLGRADLTSITGGQSLSGGSSEIVTPKAIYLRSRSTSQSVHTSKPWVEIPLAEIGATGAAYNQLVDQLQTASPLTETQLLAGSTNVRKVGTSVINGVPVTEYSGSFTMSQALASLPAGTRSAIESQLGSSGITMGTFTIWLDSHQDPRKIAVTESGGPLTAHINESVTSINQPVNVQLPTSAEIYVVPASQLSGVNGTI
jgi:hypothetical protein